MVDHAPSLSTRAARPVRVLKFGGTSVGTVERLHRAVRIIRDAVATCRPLVVVSAAGDVTDELVRAADEAPHSPASAAQWAEHIVERYRTLAVKGLDDEALRAQYGSILHARRSALRSALQSRQHRQGSSAGGSGPEASAARDAVLATGERLMAPLLAAALTDAGCRAQAEDAASLIRTDATPGCAAVRWRPTRQRVRAWGRSWTDGVAVVTGFIGGTADGTTTTLGRGGSDYSAALLARALDADRLERWTDVEALYTRDPAENDDARRLSRISMTRARDWTKEGRLGLHPRALDPLTAADIPVHVRGIHRPDAPGTHIVPNVPETSQ